MKKLFQNKSLLKSIQVFLVCLVVWGGGFLGESVKADETDCTATIDVVFYIDTSGSMNTEWTTVCGNINAIVAGIEAAGNTVNYKIYGLEMTKDCAADFIDVHCESWGPATSWVANNYPWTPGAIRIAVPMSDECPDKGNPCSDVDTDKITQAITDANDNNVVVSPIISTSGTAYTLGTNLANGTGGTISGASDSDAIIAAIITLITNEIGDQDGDGYRSVECGGDDCDDSEPSIYAGESCFNKCFDDVLKGGICQVGTGECVYDSVIMNCEEMGDPCKLDGCAEVDNGDDICTADVTPDFCKGLVPCGRMLNNPATGWNDTADCQLCHFVILADNIIDFLMVVVSLVAVLALVVGGLLYTKAAGDASLILSAKQNFNKILYGFVVIFIAWVIINIAMVLLGFTDPLGDGSWAVFNCNVP